MVKNYIVKLLPSDIDIRKAKFVLYKGEIYEHYQDNRRADKDPKIFSYIMQLDGTKGYHEKWVDLIALDLFLCSQDIESNDEVWAPTTSGWNSFIVSDVKDGYAYPGGSSIRYNLSWIYKKIAVIDEFCSWVKNGDVISDNNFILNKQSDDKKVKHIEVGDNVFVKSLSEFFEIEATVKDIEENDSIDWWDVPVLLTDVKEQIGINEQSSKGFEYKYKNLPDIKVIRRFIRYRPKFWNVCYVKCPVCKR